MRSPMGVNSRFGCLHGETLAFFRGGGKKRVRAEARRYKVVGWCMVDVRVSGARGRDGLDGV